MAIRQATSRERIVRNRRVLGGEPVVRGTRISVRSVVLAEREYGGVAGALDAYPQLRPADVQDALDFYNSHRAEIDRYIRANLDDE
jgi:uncharacterized protein (DUF433 family)